MGLIRMPRTRKIVISFIFSLCIIFIYLNLPTNSEVKQYNQDAHLRKVNPKIILNYGALPDPFDEEGKFHASHASMVDMVPDKDGLIDWHDYLMIQRESKREGPGEQGLGVITDPSEKDAAHAVNSQNGFDAFSSDKISLARSVGDLRHAECKNMKYLKELPTVSIVIPFYEEHWSTLWRTVISAVNRAPPELIKEVILVDDGSTHKPFLKEQLEEYAKEKFPEDFIKILRNENREGLIRTRLVGAKAATGDVLIFLDSHVEASVNWLPPLLDPIARDYKTVTCPFIDSLIETWAFRKQDDGGRGSFAWNFDYKRLPRLKEDAKHPHLPFDSPIMAGGLFAISRKWFWELGGYDEGLFIWGGEQYELSFKIWMCGGRMIDIPCSRIAHAYRTSGFPFPNNKPNSLSVNYKRVAEVWMDDYKEALYNKSPRIRSADEGDLSKQKKFREDMQCKSFQWFLDNVAFDLLPRYPIKTPMTALDGELSLAHDPSKCITYEDKVMKLASCSGGKFSYTFRGEIRQENQCAENHHAASITKYRCHGYYLNQKWKVTFVDENIEKGHVKFSVRSDSCLEANPSDGNVFLAKCDDSNLNQIFKFTNNNWIAANEEWKLMKVLPIDEA